MRERQAEVPRPDERFTGEEPGGYSPRLTIRRLREAQLSRDVRPDRAMIVCTNPRSGSWMLCTALARTGLAGYPSEYLIPWDTSDWNRLWRTDTAAGFLDAMLTEGTSANGVFGIKLMFGHVGHLLELARQVPGGSRLDESTLLPAVFPDPRYVWLRRRDMLRQSVSHAKAIHSGVWAVAAGDRGDDSGEIPPCDVDLVRRLLDEAVERDSQWARLFDAMGVSPLVLWYEDMVADFTGTVARVLGHVDVTEQITRDTVRSDVAPQADATTEAWVRVCRDRLPEVTLT